MEITKLMMICGLLSLMLGLSYFIINCGEEDVEQTENHEWDDNKAHTEGEI